MTTMAALWSFVLVVGLLTLTPGLDTALILRTATIQSARSAWGVVLGIQTGTLAWGILASAGITALLTASQLAYDVVRWTGAAYLIWMGARMLWSTRHPRRTTVTPSPHQTIIEPADTQHRAAPSQPPNSAAWHEASSGAPDGPHTPSSPTPHDVSTGAPDGPPTSSSPASHELPPDAPDGPPTPSSPASHELPPDAPDGRGITSSRSDALPSDALPSGRRGGFVSGWRRGLLTNLLNPKMGAFYVALLPQFIPSGASPLLYGVLLAGVHVALGLIWSTVLVTAARRLRTLLRRPRARRVLDRITGVVIVGFGLRLATEAR
ncbi:LysE family transporter [Actinoplanes bogorensis]|uniref:LysE family transporter n=1 Tax=Paractinoplanes bogorensis TaxID=1610840 RepID=A0ABS5YRT2_9ACTN|nr:LysE family translocator [Actinoplanes bogorensis]MBU2665448.1 LysE family transporter [Actinoplanes bogorensis]